MNASIHQDVPNTKAVIFYTPTERKALALKRQIEKLPDVYADFAFVVLLHNELVAFLAGS